MQITEQEKMAARTAMLITYGDGNTVTMYGLVRRHQRKARMTASERFSVETANFRQHVADHEAKGNVVLAQIYANTYRTHGRFVPAEELLVLEWRSGYWNDRRVANTAQFTGKSASA